MRLSVVLLVLLASVGAAAAQDVAGSADHPLIPRYEGARIERYDQRQYDEHVLVTGPAATGEQDTRVIEGKITRITYLLPPDRSVLEAFRNYQSALAGAGFEPIHTCERSCEAAMDALAQGYLYMALDGDDPRYVAARLPRAEGDVYASVLTTLISRDGGGTRQPVVQLDVVEIAPMEERMVVLDAFSMTRDLGEIGKAVIYGLQFDFDSDTLRPESAPQLEEIARALRDNADLNVMVVGHTDGTGSPEYNLGLSQRRAANVVAALTRDFRIAPERLVPVGVGMAAPVASNGTEAGRALNRRVELVQR